MHIWMELIQGILLQISSLHQTRFLYESCGILKLKYVLSSLINKGPSLVQIPIGRLCRDKPLSKPIISMFWLIYALLNLNESTYCRYTNVACTCLHLYYTNMNIARNYSDILSLWWFIMLSSPCLYPHVALSCNRVKGLQVECCHIAKLA